jgi:hypothetical protein
MEIEIASNMIVAAREFLNTLPASVRRKGESYVQKRAVRQIYQDDPSAAEFTAKVAGSESEPYEVKLWFDGSEDGYDSAWEADCSCPMGWKCKHAYAAMKTLIPYLMPKAEQLSFGESATVQASSIAPAERKITLTARLKAELHRPLTSDERNYVVAVERAFQVYQTHGMLYPFQLQALGFEYDVNAPRSSKPELDSPRNIFDFWNQLAFIAIHNWGREIPEFMTAITTIVVDDNAVQKRRQELRIKKWSALLEQAGEEASRPAHVPGTAEADMRIRFEANHAAIEIREPHSAKFTELKTNRAHQISQLFAGNQLNLSPGAAILWGLLSPQFSYSYRSILPYGGTEAERLLHRILGISVLRDRIVTQTETPYHFALDPLHWQLTEPTDSNGDYILRLVQADASPLPPLLVTLKGRSSFYVSADTIYTGPALPRSLDATPQEIRVPGPALETAAGIEFLRSQGIEVPTRMRERVKMVPFNICIQCEVAPIYPGSRTEECRIQMLAKTADGKLEEVWNGAQWLGENRASRKAKKKSDAIVCYDRSALHDAPQLLNGLELRWGGWTNAATMRINKLFPEIFAAFCKSLPSHVSLELAGDLAALNEDVIAGSVRLDVTEAGIDWFDLKVILDTSQTDLTPEELKLLLDAKGGYVRLRGKGWRRLQFNLSSEEDERLARLGLTARELTSEPQRLHVLQLADPAAKKFLPEEQFVRVQRRASELQARVTPDIPHGVTAELRPYQRDGFHFLSYLSANRFGGILADDMGLGKTLQTLTWLKWLWSDSGNIRRPVLVVCPKSVMDNWRSETARFTPGLQARMWTPSELEKLPEETASADLHIINYSQLRAAGESLVPVRWLAVILDEGQHIKNPSSQTAQVARSLVADYRLVLTGTPIENRLLDLWSLMTFAMPGVLGSRNLFNRQFGAKDDPLARRRLSARVRPFLVRRTKGQVAKDLPDKIEEDLFCPLEGEQRALYRAELKRAQQMLLRVQTSKELAKERFNFLTSLLRLRQICCDPRLVDANSRGTSAKLEALMEQLEPLMEEGQKVLVFSQFVALLDLIKEPIVEKGWPVFYLAGETENRGELVEKFQRSEGSAVFLISLKAGGFGLNLTSAGYVILFDPWWNPAVENQAIDRTHRIGQTQKVIAYRLLMRDTVEEKIRALQKQKRSLAEDVLGEEKFAQSLTLEDLRFLLT